jgi:MFS family permease
VSAWFDRRRGLALGLVMLGGGISAICMPILAQYLIELVGWRETYMALAVLMIVVTIPIIWIFLIESPAAAGVQLQTWGEASGIKAHGKATQTSMKPREALRSADFWLMSTSMSLAFLAALGALAHLVPILRDWGFTGREAAVAISFLGAGSLAGRVLVGWLLDRLFASYVAAILFGLSGLGFFLIGLVPHELWAIGMCTMVIGLAVGGEGDILAYMTSRYFGIASFGQIYGYAYTGMIIGGAAGPALVGAALASNIGSPQAILAVFGLVVIIAIIPVMRMSDYRIKSFKNPSLIK